MSAPGSTRAEAPLWTPEAGQWLSTSTGRIAPDGYGWMQAVHWVADGGHYRPRRSHGPAFGDTTVRIANELARFSPCRPGVDHLARRLGLSERTVQYHLQMLRQAGLLAYVERGTRVRGRGRRASEFARLVPAAFDDRLGVRVIGSGVRRRPVGMAEAGRAEMAALGRKAVRSARRRRPRAGRATPFGPPAPCTPKGVAPPAPSPTGDTRPPSEAKLGRGKAPTSTPGTSGAAPLNAVGRRFRLAAELIRRVGWLGRSSTPRIAWIVRHVADAGWSADEVMAWLHARGEADSVRRPSGLLATLLQGAETLLDTPQKRAMAVEDWRDSRAAGQRRHRGWLPATNAPRSRAVRELVTTALVPRQRTDLRPAPAAPRAPLDGRSLAPAHTALLRETARAEFMLGDSTLVRSAVRAWGGERAAEVYGEELVRRVLGLARATDRLTLASPRAAS
ncbi:transcriptional regulator [Streptomyces sp. NPDC059917]|uniref:transcriptional regulator n=1 Tax=Streptomyces sp. NPDC059917 TaxID=3347002 RepID=UPI003665A908